MYVFACVFVGFVFFAYTRMYVFFVCLCFVLPCGFYASSLFIFFVYLAQTLAVPCSLGKEQNRGSILFLMLKLLLLYVVNNNFSVEAKTRPSNIL